MELRRPRFTAPPAWIVAPLERLLTALYLAIFGIPLLIIVWLARMEDRINPDWHPVFAWWPTRCDGWLDDGFVGTVWLETIWRRNKFPHGVEFRREPPSTSAEPEARAERVGERSASTDPIPSPPHSNGEGRR